MSERYTLSVVQLCPEQYADTANQIAEAAGYGPNNLHRRLVDADGNEWRGCHAFWIPRVFAASGALPEDAPPEWAEDLAHVETSAWDNSNGTVEPLEHWRSALAELGLMEVDEEPAE